MAFVNSATVNIKVHVLFQIGFPQIYTQEWNCRIIYSSIFSFLRNLLIVLHRDYTSIHSQQQYKMVPFFPYPLYCLDFLMLTILTGVKWYLIVVLIYISLISLMMVSIFVCLMAICTSSLEKCLLRSFAHFLVGLFAFANIFSHSVGCLFIFFMIFFDVQKVLCLIRSCMFTFLFLWL